MMKDTAQKVFLIAFGIAIIYLIFLRERKTSIQTIRITDTIPGPVRVIYDTMYIEVEKPVYLTKVIHPDTVYVDTSTLLVYKDSIVNDSIRFWQDVWVSGTISFWNQKYEPIIITHEVIKEQPLFVNQVVPARKLYLSGIIGGNVETFAPGVGIDYINRKDNLYGLSVQYLNGKPLYGFRIGAKIQF